MSIHKSQDYKLSDVKIILNPRMQVKLVVSLNVVLIL